MFYYEDDNIKEFEFIQVSSEYNIGITKALASSVKVHSLLNDFSFSHGSGNLFHIGNHLFILTAAHVVDNTDTILIEESNGDTMAATVVYRNEHSDIAILLPHGKFKETKSASYMINKQHDIKAKKLHYYGYPQNLEGFLAVGFVSQSDYKRIIMQSYAWFGASGSSVFDASGRIVGVVSAIVTQMDPYTGSAFTPGNLVVVTRVYNLERNMIREFLVNGKAKSRHPD
tara:strand:+ start:296 stop:979 length:684 start_codon:yes stop_codon:yes gene_type:complete